MRQISRWLALSAALACSLWTTTAYTADARLTWTEPAELTDGTPIDPATELDRYEIDYGCTAPGQYDNTVMLLAPASEYTVTGLPDTGTCYFTARACVVDGVCSVGSNEAAKVMGSEPLGPVSNLSVTWQESQSSGVATYYVELGSGTSGTGTTGDPWTSLAHALSQTLSSGDILKVRGNTSTSETVGSSGLTISTAITIEPDTGWEPTGAGPQLKLTGGGRYAATLIYSAVATVDGFEIDNTWGVAPGRAISIGSSINGATLKNSHVSDSSGELVEVSSSATFENVWLDGSGSATVGLSPSNYVTITCKNCVFNDLTTGISLGGANATANVYSTLFYSVTNEQGTNGTYNAYYNATTKATAETWDVNTGWVTSVSTTAGVDVVNPATPDFRAESGGALDDAGDTSNSTASDMFGTTRDANPDIGYFEISSSGISQTIGQPSETDTSQALVSAKQKAFGQPSETDSAQSLTRKKQKAIGQASELDTAQAFEKAKQQLLGLTSETDTALSITAPSGGITQLVGQILETDSAQTLSGSSKRKQFGQAIEADSAQAIAPGRTYAVGLVSETDSALPLGTPQKARLLATVLETNTALPMIGGAPEAVEQTGGGHGAYVPPVRRRKPDARPDSQVIDDAMIAVAVIDELFQ